MTPSGIRFRCLGVLLALLVTGVLIGKAYLDCRRTPEKLTSWTLDEVAFVWELRSAQEAHFLSHGSYAADPSELPIDMETELEVAITDATVAGFTARVLHSRTGLICTLSVDRIAPRPDDVKVECRR